MPQIKEYIQKTEVAGPMQGRRASSEEFGMMGRALQQAGSAIQSTGEVIERRREQNELTDINVQMSQAHADFTTKYQQDLQKGTINSEEFMQKYDDYMGKAAENISTRGGRQYFQRSVAQMRMHFMESTFAAQAEMTGVKTKAAYQSAINNYSSGLMGDPSSFNTVRDLHTQYVDGLVANGSLPAKVGEQLKVEGARDLSISAIRGWIALNPHEAQAQLNSGQWDSDIDGAAKKALLSESRLGIEGLERDAEKRRRDAEQAKVQKQIQTQNDFLERMVNGQLTAKDILNSNLDAFGSGSKKQFLDMMKEDKAKTDPTVFNSVFNRIHLPDGDPNKIVDENYLNSLMGKGLALDDIKKLRAEIQGNGTEAGKRESEMKSKLMDIAKAKLTKTNPMLGLKDPNGEEQYLKFLNVFQHEYMEGRKNGKSANQLLNPDSPDYLGRFIGDFAKSPQQIMQDMTQSMKPQPVTPDPNSPNARKPGESIEQWRARTKAR